MVKIPRVLTVSPDPDSLGCIFVEELEDIQLESPEEEDEFEQLLVSMLAQSPSMVRTLIKAWHLCHSFNDGPQSTTETLKRDIESCLTDIVDFSKDTHAIV